ncbi:phosphate ABC transporter substrate-binding protein, PhoT family [Chlorobium phaeobacteroides DSM 266]|uniref:Phosphate-binding protein n=2 Tax=Chlorobium phaeobacteroides TaxID=1096 RepID=A1BFA8_CHLPD|nr:phosphate ABC transporter substrate-binding protein, PhoT family [Chlorobium phaeobacteroides DSM 266]
MKKLMLFLFVMLFAGSGSLLAAPRSIVLDGSTTVGPIAKSFAAYFTKKYHLPVTVSESGSGNGAKSLINRSCDIATMSRTMKKEELGAAKKKGVNPVATIAALDGIAVVVHPGNPVRNLTKAQIAAIYQGKVSNWNQVGGPDSRIVVIQRESNSGTQESFKELIVGKSAQIVRTAETQASNGAVKSRIAVTRTAIGFLGMGFVDRTVKPLAVNGIQPTVSTVKNRTYPVSRPLYFYTNGQPAGTIKQFVDLSKTVDGKRIVSELGFINNY